MVFKLLESLKIHCSLKKLAQLSQLNSVAYYKALSFFRGSKALAQYSKQSKRSLPCVALFLNLELLCKGFLMVET